MSNLENFCHAHDGDPNIISELSLTDFKFVGLETLNDGVKTVTLGRFEGWCASVGILGEKFRCFVWWLDSEGYRWYNVPRKGLKRISPKGVFEIFNGN